MSPLLSGAVAAAAGVMLLGWPHRPPLPGPAGVAAASVLVVVAVLLVFAPAVGPQPAGSDVPGDGLVAAGADADRADGRTGELLDAVHVGARVGGELVEGAAGGEVLEPAR